MKKNLKHLRECTDPMDKFMCLSSLQDRNETIFFKLLIENMEELGEAAALHSRTTPSSSASSLTDWLHVGSVSSTLRVHANRRRRVRKVRRQLPPSTWYVAVGLNEP